MSCHDNDENTGYMGLRALCINTFVVVYGLEANESFSKAFLIRYIKWQNYPSQAFISKQFSRCQDTFW